MPKFNLEDISEGECLIKDGYYVFKDKNNDIRIGKIKADYSHIEKLEDGEIAKWAFRCPHCKQKFTLLEAESCWMIIKEKKG